MPWIINYKEPGHWYSGSHGWIRHGYRTKDRFSRKEYKTFSDGTGGWTEWITYSRPRLPPKYFTKGYKFYQEEMNDWMRDLERERNEDYARKSKKAGRTIRPPSLENYYGIDSIPVYYSYSEFLDKARKYALRKRKKILTKKRIQRNKEIAQYRRQLILARKNK